MFKKGDRVRRIHTNNGFVNVGDTGTVTNVSSDGDLCGVRWDRLGDSAPEHENLGSCTKNLELLEPDPPIITGPETKPTNPKDRAATHRLDLSVVPASSVIAEALAWVEGDCKYGAYNYRKSGVNVSVYIAACIRHIFKMYNGEWADPTTRVPHLGNAKACLGAIIDGFAQGNINDDRPPKQDVGKLLADAEEIVKHLHETFPNGPARITEL